MFLWKQIYVWRQYYMKILYYLKCYTSQALLIVQLIRQSYKRCLVRNLLYMKVKTKSVYDKSAS